MAITSDRSRPVWKTQSAQPSNYFSAVEEEENEVIARARRARALKLPLPSGGDEETWFCYTSTEPLTDKTSLEGGRLEDCYMPDPETIRQACQQIHEDVEKKLRRRRSRVQISAEGYRRIVLVGMLHGLKSARIDEDIKPDYRGRGEPSSDYDSDGPLMEQPCWWEQISN